MMSWRVTQGCQIAPTARLMASVPHTRPCKPLSATASPAAGSQQDVIDKLSSESAVFAGLRGAHTLVNQNLIKTAGATPAPTLRPGQDSPANEQVFATPGGDWVVRVNTYAGGDVGLRWMHSVQSCRLVPGFSLALLRTNLAMDSGVTSSPAFDFEVGLFNNASILLYMNMVPRVDVLVRVLGDGFFQVHDDHERLSQQQMQPDDAYYKHYYQAEASSYDDLMQMIASDPDCKPYRSKSVHIRIYSSTGALVMMPATEESVEKINQWGLAAAGIWDSAANNPASRVLDDALRAQLAARDAMLRAMPRRDPDNAMAEAALGKEMFEQILQVNAGDLRVDP